MTEPESAVGGGGGGAGADAPGFRRLAETLPQVVWTAAPDGRRDYFNARWYEFTGLAPAGSLGDAWLDAVHPDDRPAYRRAWAGGRPFAVELRLRRRDGAYRRFVLRAEPFGDAPGWFGTCDDVTERERAAKRLRDSELWFRATFENAAVGIAHVAPDGRWLRVNETFCTITGYRREELLAGTFQDITHPDDLAADLENAERLLAGEAGTYSMEKRYLRRDGSAVWADLTVALVRTPAGEPEFFISVVQDVTSRKKAEGDVRRLNAELHASLQELQTIFDAMPVGINVARDPQCKVIVGNAALMEMFGVGSGENISKSRDDADALPFRIYHGAREPRADELPMQRAAATGRPVDDELYQIERADGTRVDVFVRAHPVRDAAGAVTGAVGICLDITPLRRAEEALREADRRKDEFLAMLAHELRNPLAAITNAHRVARSGDATPDDLVWAVDVIDRQLRQLGRLIDDLLDVSRITRGKIRLKRERVDAAAVVARAVESARNFVESRGHRLTVGLGPGPLPLHADPARLEQVFANLLNNAAKYTDPGGEIALTADAEAGAVVVRVRDNGVGIPAAMLPKVFDLFAQVDDSLERSHGGLGIGLTLVRTLVEMHGGEVSAESGGPGRGSEFTVRLPMLTAPPRAETRPAPPPVAAPPAAAPPAAAPARGGARRLLVVDDNADTLRGMARLLTRLGREVVTAADGPGALAAARENRPEAVVLDIGLPGMSGYDVAATLRAEFGPGLLLVALSGYAQDRDRQRSREAGFDHHLAKPVNLDALLALLDAPRPG